MRQKSAVPGLLAVGAVTLMLLLSVACESPLPTAQIRALPTDTPAPTPTPLLAAPTLPAPEEKEEKETVVPTMPTQNMGSLDPDAERMVAIARADLMQRLGVTEEAILVKSVEEKQWRNSSLGCPQPGMMYTQVITPGFLVVLEAEGQTYEYHTDAGRFVVLCEADGLPIDPDPVILIAPHGKRPAKP